MNAENLNQSSSMQQNLIEKGFDFLEGIDIKEQNSNRKVPFLRYFFLYMKLLPLFLFLALFLTVNVDSSGGITIISEFQGVRKYIYAAIITTMLFTIFQILAAILFPQIVQCEFEDGSYKHRLKLNLSYAGKLLEIVKTSENLKVMSAALKTSLDNSNDLSNVLLTLLASIGIFIVSFTILIGLRLNDGGVLTPLISLGGVYLLNVLRVQLARQNIKRRFWLLIIETAQNLKFDEKRIFVFSEDLIIIPPIIEKKHLYFVDKAFYKEQIYKNIPSLSEDAETQ
jgi:hypothetical protein